MNVEELKKYNLVDMAGEVYGRLTVTSYAGKSKWNCSCSCGNNSIVHRKHLVGDGTKSCGCLSKDKKGYQANLAGQRFDNLLVVNLDQITKTRRMWNTLCDCGRNKLVSSRSLIQKIVTSCGWCEGKNGNKRLKNLANQIFGRLTAIRRVENNSDRPCWECLCQCGNTTIVDGTSLKRGNTKSCGCLKIDSTKRRCGSNHPSWNANLTEEDRKRKERYRQSNQHTLWRQAIYRRDNHTCQVTGIRGGKLRAHHLFSFHANPDLRFDINNGITLNYEIHKLFHKIYGVKNNNPEQFTEFVERYNNQEWPILLKNIEEPQL